jgi:sulfite reductase (ferredoxin)
VGREGKSKIRDLLSDLTDVPDHADDASLYSDWGDPREFGIGDLGKGECAGEVVSRIDFALAASERLVFEAQLLLEEGKNVEAARKAFEAMLAAADGVVRLESPDASREPDAVVENFRRLFFDTELFFDPYAGGKFAHYFFAAHRKGHDGVDADRAHQRIEESQLFIEAAHACHRRWLERLGRTTVPA